MVTTTGTKYLLQSRQVFKLETVGKKVFHGNWRSGGWEPLPYTKETRRYIMIPLRQVTSPYIMIPFDKD